jgi:hypothetical protein
MNKKAQITFVDHWTDIVALLVLVLGLVLSFISGSLVLTYIVAFLCGMVVGRYLYHRQHRLQLRFFYIILAFIVGFALGARYGNFKVIIFLFVVGAITGNYIHKKKWLP